ncbi:predicted protein [Naegleria gruberi]|uniref:Predicted protein n=1 Tax=Naegleria gruberi TaxID=5762 RepID=D2V306_NAEGR|nr:uncharacterized protein NAEGRDRAFT_56967 [Naegleria gruberi]EFC48696.1 predicted protein [Naegleria gruberi]|eukprot:XP_002681440.1 predicted protein [Naegleria gruberi strain NEG-M]
MKALLRNLLPGSAHNRAVDDMIDANSNNNNNNNKDDDSKKKKKSSHRTKSLFSSSSSQLPSSSATTNYHQRVASQQQHHSNTTGCLARPDDSGLEDDSDGGEEFDHHHDAEANYLSGASASNVQYPQSLNALSSSYGHTNGGHQYFNTNLSKQSSNSSVLSSSSNGGTDSSLVVQTRSSPNVMQHSPRGNTSSSSSDVSNHHHYMNNNGQSSPSPSSSTPGGTTAGNITPKRRSSLSNALRRLSLKKSSSANNATTYQQQHSDTMSAGVIGLPINFADLMMSQSSSTSSIPIHNHNNNNNYGGSFSSSNSILSSTASTTTQNNNNSNYLGYNNNQNPDQLLYTPNSPPTSPMSPLSFASAQPHHHHAQHQSLQPHLLSSFTATPILAGTEQVSSSSSSTTSNNNNNNNSKRKSLNVITVGLSNSHTQSSATTPSASQQQQHYSSNYSSTTTYSATTTTNNSYIGTGSSGSNHCSPSFFEPHSPSMMLMMASQSPLLNNSTSSSSSLGNHNQQQYYSVGSNINSQQSSSSIMGQSGTQRATGTQQLLDVFVNRRKWKEILCVNTTTAITSSTLANNSNNINTSSSNNSQSSNTNENKLLSTPTSSMKGADSARAASPLSPESMSIISTSTSTEEEETEQSYSTVSNYSPQFQPQASLQQQLPQHVGIEYGDEFKLPNSPNENIFRTVVLGGFLSYKDVLRCDLVCRAWHLRISHSKENFIYFLPQLLSSISVWEEKDELQIMLATQIARNLSHLEMSKRMLMVLFGLYRRSLHKEKIFNRAVFKEVLRSEVPDLLGLTDKANMFYKLTSPTWFSPYEHFQCPIYLYLAKRSLRFVEKVDGEFQQRVQVLLKIKYNHEETISPSQAFLSLSGPPGSGVNSACASPTLSPNVNPTRKLSLVANSPLLRSVDTRTLNDYSPDRTESSTTQSSTLNPPNSPLLNFSTTSTSPSTKQLAQHQSTLVDMINEIKTCWFFAYGTIDKDQSDMQDRAYPTPSPNSQHNHHQTIVTTGHHHHHEKPILVHEKIVKYFSQFSLARMKNEVVFPEDEDCPSPIPFSASKATDKTNRITSNIEHCYHEMTQFRNDPHGEYPSIKLADPELCEQFNGTISKWICELQKLGLYQIEFVLQYVLKLLFFICTGPMYDRSELYFGVTSLHEMMENDQLDTICTDPEASRERLQQWILDYRSKHVDSHIYHYYLKIKYECSGFTGGCDEESYLLTLRVSPDFSNFEFVSYLFESRYCKGMAISSLPLFIKKM